MRSEFPPSWRATRNGFTLKIQNKKNHGSIAENQQLYQRSQLGREKSNVVCLVGQRDLKCRELFNSGEMENVDPYRLGMIKCCSKKVRMRRQGKVIPSHVKACQIFFSKISFSHKRLRFHIYTTGTVC